MFYILYHFLLQESNIEKFYCLFTIYKSLLYNLVISVRMVLDSSPFAFVFLLLYYSHLHIFHQMIFITSHSADDISYVLLSIILTPFLLKYAQKFVVLFAIRIVFAF